MYLHSNLICLDSRYFSPDPSQRLVVHYSSLAGLFETAVNEFFGSFLPALSRVRREARDEGKSGGYQDADYLDTIVTGMGALMDRQSCRLRVTCNAGKVIQNNIPGAQVAVMLLESLMPQEWRVQHTHSLMNASY